MKYKDVKTGEYFTTTDGSVCFKLNRKEFNIQLCCVVESEKYTAGEVLTISDNSSIGELLGWLDTIRFRK